MSEEEEPTGLEFFTAEQMADELARRYRAVLVTYTGALKGDPALDEHIYYFRGGFVEALGLVTATKHRILSSHDRDDGDE